MPAKLNQVLLSRAPQVFVMCCDMRSFSAVAQALGLTQSAVSKIIAGFERELGVELFIRNVRPLSLTPEARILHQHLRQVSGEFSRVMTLLQSQNSIRPVLRVGILESLTLTIGVEVIRRAIPVRSQVTVLTASANVLEQRLMERKLDLVITNGITGDPRRIYRIRLFDEPSILMLPRKLVEANPSTVWDWPRLQRCGLPLIGYWKETGAGMLNDLFLRSHDLQFPERIFVDNNIFMVKLVAEGIGWAFSRPTTVLEMPSLIPSISVQPMQKPLLTRTVYVMGREGEFEDEARMIGDLAMQTVREELAPRILELAPWLEGVFRL